MRRAKSHIRKAGPQCAPWPLAATRFTYGRLQRRKAAYLSLGDRESHTKNQRLAAVEACTDASAAILRESGLCVLQERNAGGHFSEVPQRIARGVSQMLALHP